VGAPSPVSRIETGEPCFAFSMKGVEEPAAAIPGVEKTEEEKLSEAKKNKLESLADDEMQIVECIVDISDSGQMKNFLCGSQAPEVNNLLRGMSATIACLPQLKGCLDPQLRMSHVDEAPNEDPSAGFSKSDKVYQASPGLAPPHLEHVAEMFGHFMTTSLIFYLVLLRND
jgi:hypothetical protein